MELRVIRTEEAFNQIRPQWDELLSTLDPIPLPLTHAWLQAWWRAFSINMQLEFRCVYIEGALVGVAPLFRVRERYRGVPVTLLKLAANGHTPYSSIVVDSAVIGRERDAVLGLLTKVGCDEIGLFFKIHQSGDLKRFLQDRSMPGHNRVGEKPSLYTPVIRIDQPWEAFYRSRPRKLKKSLNHKLNRFGKNAAFSIHEETISSPDQDTVRELVEISANSWKATVGNDLRSNERSRRFLHNLIESFGPTGLLSAWIIRDGERPVAFEVHLKYDDIVYPIRADFDESYKAYSPGSVLEYTALKRLFENGLVKEYYTCADDYWYLSNWTSEYQSYCTVELFGSSPKLHLLYLLEYQLIPVLKRFLGKRAKQRRRPDGLKGE